MNTILDYSQELDRITSLASDQLKHTVPGHLRSKTNGNRYEYYHVTKKDPRGKYIKKSEHAFAHALAQQEYSKQILNVIEQQKESIGTIASLVSGKELSDVYNNMSPARKAMVSPYYLSDEDYVAQWQAVEYEPMHKWNDSDSFLTDRGETVRSKSELIIANKLFSMGIPYRYEYPIKDLSGNIVCRPDFTALNVNLRREIFIEHFGLMDDAKYRDVFMKKMNTYPSYGIYSGYNFIAFFEDSSHPLNMASCYEVLKKTFIS